MANLNQFGIVLVQYRTDNNGKLPPVGLFWHSTLLQSGFTEHTEPDPALPESAGILNLEHKHRPDGVFPHLQLPRFQGRQGRKMLSAPRRYRHRWQRDHPPLWTGIAGANGAIATQPMLHSAVPSKEWALKDDISWDTSTPPNHDTFTRNALFFDGRVGMLDLRQHRLCKVTRLRWGWDHESYVSLGVAGGVQPDARARCGPPLFLITPWSLLPWVRREPSRSNSANLTSAYNNIAIL
jgi:hypothetical protein